MSEYPLVSIIIPVYNVEKYLEKCVASVLKQSYPNIEVVLVNDGSSDKSGEICDSYSADARITVIHQKNKGLSNARNNGLKKAKAKYIAFVDSDDYISSDCIEYLYKLMIKFNADISVGRGPLVYEDGSYLTSSTEIEECLNANDALVRMCYKNGLSNSAWGKLYKRELLEKYPYPEGWLFEDLATTYKIIGDCKRIAIGSHDIYFYVQRKGSIVRRPIDSQMLLGIRAAQNQVDYISLNYPSALLAAKYCYAFKIIQFIPNILENTKQNKKAFKTLQKYLRKYYREVLLDTNAKWTVKIRIIAMLMGYTPTRIIGKFAQRNKFLFNQ